MKVTVRKINGYQYTKNNVEEVRGIESNESDYIVLLCAEDGTDDPNEYISKEDTSWVKIFM